MEPQRLDLPRGAPVGSWLAGRRASIGMEGSSPEVVEVERGLGDADSAGGQVGDACQ